MVLGTSSEAEANGVQVYNFTVANDHTYFVEPATGGPGATPGTLGVDGLWVHNTCADAYELRQNLLGDGETAAKYAAHLVPTGDFSGRTEIVQQAIQGSQDILENVGIDLNDGENGFFTNDPAQNGTHTDKFFLTMFRHLGRAVPGGEEGVIQALEELKAAAQAGSFQAGG